jgi:hypothetical protein
VHRRDHLDPEGQPQPGLWALDTLHALVRSARLGRHQRGAPLPTIAGIGADDDIAGTWRRVAGALAGPADFDRAAFEACMLSVVAEPDGCRWNDAIVQAALALGEVGWRSGGRSAEPPPEFVIAQGAATGRQRLRLFGALTEDGEWSDRTVGLTPSGEALVLTWLREIAAGPRISLI